MSLFSSLTDVEENQEIIYSPVFCYDMARAERKDFYTQIAFSTSVSVQVQIGVEESNPEFQLNIPIKPQAVVNLTI